VSNFEAVDTELTAIDSEYLLNNFERGSVTGFELEKLVPARTYAAAGIDRLTKLARAMGMESKTDEIASAKSAVRLFGNPMFPTIDLPLNFRSPWLQIN
jgi:hypothetical protein